jgi:diacylglycerol kinase family enzyme
VAPRESKPSSRVLIISPNAGSMTSEVIQKLRDAFPDYRLVDFNPRLDFAKLLTPHAKVVVAGGDGTIGFVARALADSDRTLGIVSLGTFNNFAKSLGLPRDPEEAIRALRNGRPHAITVGRVNGRVFLEAAAIGMFGAAIELGEAAKDLAWGQLRKKLSAVTGAKPFQYVLSGDINGHGRALSLVFANTPSIGAAMAVSAATPIDPYLELSVHAGESRTDILSRLVTGRLRNREGDNALDMGLRFTRLRVETKPRVPVYTDNLRAGMTPAEIRAEVGALKVLLPPRLAEAA